jgi:hypothetical protein
MIRPPQRHSPGIVALLSAAVIQAVLPRLSAAETADPKSPTPSTPIPIPALQKKVDFETHVLPIFKRNCLACHNATDAEGDLVLETPATILKGGENGPVVVPHKRQDSLLLKSARARASRSCRRRTTRSARKAVEAGRTRGAQSVDRSGRDGHGHRTKAKPVQWRPLPPGLHPILAVAVTRRRAVRRVRPGQSDFHLPRSDRTDRRRA